MLGSQYIISPHEPNVFLEEDPLYEHEQQGLGLYDYDEVCSLPMSFSQNRFPLHFDY